MVTKNRKSHLSLKFLLLVSFLFFTALVSPLQANAESLHSWGLTKQNTTSFLSQKIDLLPTFKNPSSSYNLFMKKHRQDIEIMQSTLNLPDLTPQTANMYHQALFSYDLLPESSRSELLAFCDWFENDFENQATLQEIAQIEREVASKTISKQDACEIVMALCPETTANEAASVKLLKSNTFSTLATSKSKKGFNVKKATAYAKKYGPEGKYNRKFGYEKKWIFFAADCTNFASQILNAGGVSMVYYSDTHKGWWWKSKTKKSVSWTRANTFKNYMGSRYKTKRWGSFKSNVKAGDFIGLDSGSDGSVDHIGYVCEKSSKKGLKIAQHSRDYVAWNGSWPNASGTYYRVRR